MDQQRLGRVAHAGPVGLGVEDDGQRLVQVGPGIDVDVAVAGPGLDHRDRRLLHDAADQPRAAAGDEHVDQAAGAHQRLDAVVGLARDQLHHIGVQARRDRGVAEHGDDGGVAGPGAGAAPQQHRVAGLQADAGGVRGDVGAGLVDDPDHPERDPHLAQLQPVGQGAAAHHLPDRVRQAGHLTQPLGHPLEPRWVQPQPVHQVAGRATGLGASHVLGVGGQHLLGPSEQRLGHRRAALGPSARGSRARGRGWRSGRGGRRPGSPAGCSWRQPRTARRGHVRAEPLGLAMARPEPAVLAW